MIRRSLPPQSGMCTSRQSPPLRLHPIPLEHSTCSPHRAGLELPGGTDIGHTSRNDLPEFGFEGGDTEIRGSWQKKKLREVTTDDPIDSLTVQLLQFDDDVPGSVLRSQRLCHPGIFGVSGTAPAVEKALLVVIEDGTERLGFWVPKASIKRDDAIQLPIDDFAAMPIKATFLDDVTNNLFEWINEDLFNTV